MPRQKSSAGVRAGRLVRAAAAVAGAVLCLVATTASPAAAEGQQPVTVTVDCVVPGTDGTYRAVFGYDSPNTRYTIPVGENNKLTPQSLNGIQPKKFDIGEHRAAFTTPAIPNGQQVTWMVYTADGFPASTATASSASSACGPQVSLPADGNGTGPVVIVAASLVVTFLMLALRRRPSPAPATARAEPPAPVDPA